MFAAKIDLHRDSQWLGIVFAKNSVERRRNIFFFHVRCFTLKHVSSVFATLLPAELTACEVYLPLVPVLSFEADCIGPPTVVSPTALLTDLCSLALVATSISSLIMLIL